MNQCLLFCLLFGLLFWNLVDLMTKSLKVAELKDDMDPGRYVPQADSFHRRRSIRRLDCHLVLAPAHVPVLD